MDNVWSTGDLLREVERRTGQRRERHHLRYLLRSQQITRPTKIGGMFAWTERHLEQLMRLWQLQER